MDTKDNGVRDALHPSYVAPERAKTAGENDVTPHFPVGSFRCNVVVAEEVLGAASTAKVQGAAPTDTRTALLAAKEYIEEVGDCGYGTEQAAVMAKIDAALAAPVEQAELPTDLVTSESALAALDYLDRSNELGRKHEAQRLLVAAEPHALSVLRQISQLPREKHGTAVFMAREGVEAIEAKGDCNAALRAAPAVTDEAASYGFVMQHKSGGDRGFSWRKDDPLFSDDWERIELAPASGESSGTAEVESIGNDPESDINPNEPFYKLAHRRGLFDFSLTISGNYSDEKLQALREQWESITQPGEKA